MEEAQDNDVRINNDAWKRLAVKEEQKLLSIILKSKDLLSETINFGFIPGKDGHFAGKETRLLFDIIHSNYKKFGTQLTRGAIDSIVESSNEINGKKLSEEDKSTIRMFYDKTYNTPDANADDYKLLRESIKNRYIQWKMYVDLKWSVEQILKVNNTSELALQIKDKITRIDLMEQDQYSLSLSMKEGMEHVLEHIRNRRENPDTRAAILCGIKAIDDVFNGFEKGSYTVVTGMVNGGKSTMMFNIAFNMAKAGHKVLYVSIEKKAVPILTRLLALHSLVDYNRIKIGGKSERGLSDYYYNRLTAGAEELKNTIPNNFITQQHVPGTPLSKIITAIEKDEIKYGIKFDAIILDYLSVVGKETNHPGRPDLDEAIVSQRFQSYGRVKNVVAITGAQLKTPSAKEIRGKAKKVTLEDSSSLELGPEDIAGSKMIIADAENAIGCVLNSDSPPNKMFVYIIKARDDESRKTLILDFDGKLGRVCDPEFTTGMSNEIDKLVYNKHVDMKKEKENIYDTAKKLSDDILKDDNQEPFNFNEPDPFSPIQINETHVIKKPIADKNYQKMVTEIENPKQLTADEELFGGDIF